MTINKAAVTEGLVTDDEFKAILEAAARQVVPLPIEWTPVGGRLVNEEIMEGVLAEAHILR